MLGARPLVGAAGDAGTAEAVEPEAVDVEVVAAEAAAESADTADETLLAALTGRGSIRWGDHGRAYTTYFKVM
jgi:hypothetical protein